jgi:outer membrane immunogenic protein
MYRFARTLFLCASATLTIQAASAADLPARMATKAPAYIAQTYNWTGVYGGIFGGYHDGDITQSGCVGMCAVDPHLRGGIFGLQAGFDYQFSNNIVTGVFGWVPLVRPETTINIGPGADFDVRPQFAAVVAGRVGYAINNWLPYAFGGVALSSVKVHSRMMNLTPSNSYTGPAFGVGVEYAFLPNWSVDLRYTYLDFPKKTYDFGGGPEQYGEHSNNFTVGLNYRFPILR